MTTLLLTILVMFTGCGSGEPADQGTRQGKHKSIPGCEDCELIYEGMPSDIGTHAVIATADEPGEHLEMSGIALLADGTTPAADVIIYVYHTDNAGLYSKTKNEKTQHGHLRGWMKTNERGAYSFSTIRPASYPNSRNPQHIHVIILEPDNEIYWIDDFLFSDDPLIAGQPASQTSGVVHPVKSEQGVWIATRNIILK
jgi:protocatechuate 3,4-dioxygenase beta subunit